MANLKSNSKLKFKTLTGLMCLAMGIYAHSAWADTPNNPINNINNNINAQAKDADAFAPEQSTGLNQANPANQTIQAQKFMVASANPLATQAGYNILKQGGSAIDAMIAVQSTLGLVEPQSSGLGGGAFVVYWDNQKQKLTTFDARETAPQSATPQLFLDENNKPLKYMKAVVGGRSVGVPAIPKLMDDLHKKYGKLKWNQLFNYPIELAEKGFAVSPRMSKSIQQNSEYLARFPKTAAYFLPNNQALQAGTILKNLDYANSLKILAKERSKPFYHGDLAKNIVSAVQNLPENEQSNAGKLELSDLQKYRVIERPAVCSAYREYQVCGMGAPSSGGIALGQILGILNHFKLNNLNNNDLTDLRLLGDASRLAFADRDWYIGDPDFVQVQTSQLLNPDYLKQRADLIKNSYENKSLRNAPAGQFNQNNQNNQSHNINKNAIEPALELPSTSHISIVDAQGNVLSMTTSIENAFGSTLMANGYLLNNELTDFNFDPEKNGTPAANRVQGGKRPRSSMSPTIVLKNNQPYLAVGSPGGSRIIGYVAKTLVAHLDWGMNIQDAISFPNILNRFGTYELEQNTSANQYVKGLEELGYKTEVRDLNSGVQAILINPNNPNNPNNLIGGADPRREGKVMGD